MGLKKGQTGNPNGRPAGTPNKVTKLVKETIATVFSELQEDPAANLTAWAKQNPTEFYRLASKLIPIQIGADPDSPVLGNLADSLTFEQAYQIKYDHLPGEK